jgi:hypothetical protein
MMSTARNKAWTLKALSQSFSEVGMARQASRALRDSEWLLVRAISLNLSDDVPPLGASCRPGRSR